MIEPGQFAHFGTFVFDLKQRMLTRNGGVVALAPKDVEILLMLIEGCGQVVERQEIIERVWPKTFVEEANLSRHIFTLRQILCEGGSRVIETIPKRGYRFVTPIASNLPPLAGRIPMWADRQSQPKRRRRSPCYDLRPQRNARAYRHRK